MTETIACPWCGAEYEVDRYGRLQTADDVFHVTSHGQVFCTKQCHGRWKRAEINRILEASGSEVRV